MHIIVNGKPHTAETPALIDLLQTLGYTGDFFAVAVNRTVVPRTQYAATVLHEGNEVEILSPMQGG